MVDPILVGGVVAGVTIDELLELVEVGVDDARAVPPLIDATIMVLGVAVTVRRPDDPLVMLSGTATTYMVPALAKVVVTVVAPVKEVLLVTASDDAILCALAIAAEATGTPFSAQMEATGLMSAVMLRLLSQLDLMQEMRLVRKLPLDNRQRH